MNCYPIIPLWIGGKWNKDADPRCDKCLMGFPHAFDRKGQPIHDTRAFNLDRSLKEGDEDG